VSEARLFYTKLDDIFWSEFVFAQSGTQPADILAGFSNMSTAHLWGRGNYLVLAHGDVHDPTFGTITAELLYANGYQDTLTKLATAAETDTVVAYYLSKTIRGTMLNEKRSLLGYINFSTPSNSIGQTIDFSYNWLTEADTSRSAGTAVPAVVDWHEGLVRIPGPEFFRNLRFELTVTLSSAISEYTILGSALDVDTHRKTPRDIS
jgi:hypothetical protein